MQHEVIWNKNLFSNSIKKINRTLPITMNPQQLPKQKISHKNQISSKKYLAKRRAKLAQSRRKYEEMIDDIIKRHVQQTEMQLRITKVLKKHQYKNYRIIPSESNQQNGSILQKIQIIKPLEQLQKPRVKCKSITNRVKTINLMSEIKGKMQDKDQHKLPRISASPKVRSLVAYRDPIDFFQIQLKLKKLRDQASIDQINDFHKKISRRCFKTEASLV